MRERLRAGAALLIAVTGVTCSATSEASVSQDVLALSQMCAGEARPTDLET